MAGLQAAQSKKEIALIERNSSVGRKILLTGKGRCNITNIAPITEFLTKFEKQGLFLIPAFHSFFNQDLINFFQDRGLQMKIERQGRVFPVTDNASSVVDLLKRSLWEVNIHLLYNSRVVSLKRRDEGFRLSLEQGQEIQAKKVILSTGGASFRATGSSGDGFNLAKSLGHTIIPLSPGLVPLKTKETWVNQLAGITLKNIQLTFVERERNKKITSEIGELLFTHFGVSGPLILDLSARIVDSLNKQKRIDLLIDLKPALSIEQVDKRLLNDINSQGSKEIKSLLKGLLPLRMIPVIIDLLGLDGQKRCSYLSQQERYSIINLLKALKLTITGSLSLEEAMVTCGGVSTKEINPQTMESKIIPGLYFAGEIIDVCGKSGGYNLQQAFSTGYLAGQQAARI